MDDAGHVITKPAGVPGQRRFFGGERQSQSIQNAIAGTRSNGKGRELAISSGMTTAKISTKIALATIKMVSRTAQPLHLAASLRAAKSH
jgi:hypothetical protein